MRWTFVAVFLAGCDAPTTDANPPTTSDDGMPCADAFDRDDPAVLEVHRYLWNDVPHLLFRADCCDRYDQVLRQSDCAYVCAPSGGFSGEGDGECPDFFDQALDRGQVWP